MTSLANRVHDVEALATSIVARAVQARSPRHSVGAALRHLARELPAETVREVRALAEARLPVPTPTLSIVDPSRRWLRIAAAAELIGVSQRTLLQRLRYPKFRRLYGWPVWDGEWRFTPDALDPATSASFRASQPDREPFGNLPSWCVSHG